MNKLLLLCVLCLPSCGLMSTLDKIEKAADQLTFKVTDIDKSADSVLAAASQLGEKGAAIVEKVQAVKDAVHAADKDQSGTISGWTEIATLISGLLAVFGIGKAHAATKATNELYDMHVENVKAIAAGAAPK